LSAERRTRQDSRTVRIAVVAQSTSPTNHALVRAGTATADWALLTPAEALEQLVPGDCAIGRIDVLPTLDGVDEGLWALGTLEARGVTVLNGAPSLLAAHDKLLTARLLRAARLPHPRTRLIAGDTPVCVQAPPLVVKPRFGSWGLGVQRCDDRDAVVNVLASLPSEPWYRANGALVQELVPPFGFDLRIVVANGKAVGAITRVAEPGEWRTNVALGAVRRQVRPSRAAVAVAIAAAHATGAALVGVDLLPNGRGGWVIVELNGAVDFTAEYALELGHDPFADAAEQLADAARFATLDAPARAAVAAQRC
jgi:RimK family alpha-L-glutamate ligase